MIINKIKLENFKSHKNTELELNHGLSIIIGHNGAGKSTLLEAIRYAFFKEFDGKLDDLKRKTSEIGDNVKQMLVTIEFEHNGNQYQVIRGKRKTTNIAKLYTRTSDGYWQLKTDGDRNLTKDLETLLDLDSKSFENAVYIKQGDITELIDKKPSERKEFISKLLNIDSLEKAYKNMNEIIKEYENKKNILNGELKQKKEVETKIEEMEKSLNEENLRLKELTDKKSITEKEYSELEKKYKEVEEKQNKHITLKNRLDTEENNKNNSKNLLMQIDAELNSIYEFEKEINKLKNEIKNLDKLKEIREHKTNYDLKKEELSKINQEYRRIENTQNNIDNTKEDYEKYLSYKDKQKDLEEKKLAINQEKEKLNIIKAELDQKKARKNDLKEKINNIANKAARLLNLRPTGPQDIQNALTSNTKKNNEDIENIKEQINKNDTLITLNLNKRNETSKSLEDLMNTEDTCPICQSNITHEKHEELEKQYKEIINNCNLNLEKLQNENKEYNEKLASLNEFKEELEEFNIPSLIQDNNEFEKLLDELKKLDEIKIKIAENNNAKETIEEEIRNNKEMMNQLEENYQKHITSNELIKELGSLEDIKSQEEAIRNKLNLLNQKIKELSQHIPPMDNLDLKIKYLEKSKEKYNRLLGKVENKETKLEQKEELSKKILYEENNIHDIEVEIAELSFNQETYDELKNKCSSSKDEIDIIDKKIIEKTVTSKEHEKILNENKIKLNELNELDEEQRTIKEYLKILNHIRELYDKDHIQKDIRERSKPRIEYMTNKIFQEFDFEYDALKLNEDYEITINKDVEEFPLSSLSGGEKIVVALALRLGIAQTITQNKTELLILDEPTVHLDSERKTDLIEIINKINIVPQMLVVTHDDEMLSSSNDTIRITKENGISIIETG